MAEPVRKRSYVPWLIVALLGGVLLIGYRFFFTSDEAEGFTTEEVVRSEIVGSVSATGTLESITTVTVGSQVSGPVAEVLVDFNSPVTENQILAKINPAEFEARLDQMLAGLESAQADLQNAVASLSSADAAIAQARAQVTSAEANVEQARSGIKNAEAGVENAKASILRAQAEMDNALIQYQRSEKLYRRELIAESELDQARTTYRVQSAGYQTALAGKTQAEATVRQSRSGVLASRGDLEAAQTRLQAALAQRESAQAQIASAQARVSQAQANADQARVDLQRTVLRSPIDGIVIERKVDVGQTVAAAFQAPELFVIAEDLREMQVRVDVSEADIGRVKLGQPVTFTVDAYSDRDFEGKVTQVRSAPASETANAAASNVVVYGVLVSVVNDEQLLKPGLTATVSIETERIKDALLVPNAALRFVPDDSDLPEKEEKKSDESGDSKKKKPKKRSGEKKKKKEKTRGRRGAAWIEGEKYPEKIELTLGLSDENYTVVLEGNLKEGDQVITRKGEISSKKKRRRFRMRI